MTSESPLKDTRCQRCHKPITIWRSDPPICFECRRELRIFLEDKDERKNLFRAIRVCGYWEGLRRWVQEAKAQNAN